MLWILDLNIHVSINNNEPMSQKNIDWYISDIKHIQNIYQANILVAKTYYKLLLTLLILVMFHLETFVIEQWSKFT